MDLWLLWHLRTPVGKVCARLADKDLRVDYRIWPRSTPWDLSGARLALSASKPTGGLLAHSLVPSMGSRLDRRDVHENGTTMPQTITRPRAQDVADDLRRELLSTPPGGTDVFTLDDALSGGLAVREDMERALAILVAEGTLRRTEWTGHVHVGAERRPEEVDVTFYVYVP